MKWWMPWLVPLALLVGVVAVTVFRRNEGVLIFAGGALLVLVLGAIVFGPRGDEGRDPDTHWRMRDWRRGG
jgi:hypothetical protein